MVAVRRRIEYYTAVEHRRVGLHASEHVRIPEFELAAVVVSPVSIEVDKNVDTALQIQRNVVIEVGMNR